MSTPSPIRLDFETPPPLRMQRALLHRPRPAPGVQVPRMEAHIARAVLSDDATYRRLCGFVAGGPLPITLPHILAAPAHMALATHKDMPIPAMGLVHVENVIVAHRPLLPDTPVQLHCWVEGQRTVRAGVEVDIHTTLTTLDGQPLWEEVSTALSRALPGDGRDREPEPEPLTHLRISAHWSLPEDLGRRYGALSRDYNPIHVHALTARLFGFPRAIIHGMWTLARCVAALEQEAPCTLTVRFRRPAFLPSSVFFNADHDGRFEVRAARTGKLILDGALTEPPSPHR